MRNTKINFLGGYVSLDGEVMRAEAPRLSDHAVITKNDGFYQLLIADASGMTEPLTAGNPWMVYGKFGALRRLVIIAREHGCTSIEFIS
jgi:hypothetical protein